MYFTWWHYHRNIVERNQNENVHSHINEFEACVVWYFVQKSFANIRFLRSSLSCRHWRDSSDEELIHWRIKYDRFCELWNILFRIISFFVTSIILENELIAKLIKKLRFNENVKFIHESMNREKIFFNVQNIHVAFIVNFENFRFLIANVNQSLKKIILYEEKIQTFINVKQTLIKCHVKTRKNVDQIEKKIKCYNEKMSNFEKIKIYENFSQLNFVI
jgi:hypothetical protein